MWKKKHVEAFWDDVMKQRNTSANQKGAESHFFGPIVTLSKPKDGIIEILDGQQRLATVTILFCVIRDVAEDVYKKTGVMAPHDLGRKLHDQFIYRDDKEYSLELGETDKNYFRETIQQLEPLNSRAKIFTHRNIRAARETLREKVLAALGGPVTDKTDAVQAVEMLTSLRQTLVSDLVMARIEVTSQESAFKIFTTLNDRGLRLSPPDLLLSYLMEKAPEADRKVIRGLWTEMIQRMGTHDIDRFVRHMWISKYGDLKNEDLFTALKRQIEDAKLSSLDFVRVVGDECDNYIQLLMVEEQHLPDGSTPLVKAITRELGFQYAYPLLLSSYLLLQDADFIKVAGYILVFITRYSIISNLDSGGMEDLLYKLAREVRAMVKDSKDVAGSTAATKHVRDIFVANTPDDQKTKTNAADIKLTFENAEAKYLLTRLANYRQDPQKMVGLAETNLEHIYPQNPDPNEWGGPANQDKLEPLTWNLGNLTIYGKKANRKAGNREYTDKQPKYKESKILMTQDIANSYATWDENSIKDRAAKLSDSIIQVWRFDNTSRV